MRPSSPGLSHGGAFGRGAAAQGADVTEIGLATDQLYFATGALELAGAMFTASHNPAQYNGIKMCRAGAAPSARRPAWPTSAPEQGADRPRAPDPGTLSGRPGGRLTDYAAYLRDLVDLTASRTLKVVVDAGNGMGGHTVPTVFEGLPPRTGRALYFELDGTFPNHEANPLDPKNIVDLQARVRGDRADLGLAFDGDADRCSSSTSGEPVSPSAITALVAARELARAGRHPGGRSSTTASPPGRCPRWSRSAAAPPSAPASATPSSRPRWPPPARSSAASTPPTTTSATSGTPTPACSPPSTSWPRSAASSPCAPKLMDQYDRYAASGEINSTVAEPGRHRPHVHAKGRKAEVAIDELDGLTVTAPPWWFNLRPSNTEPLLRLNVEASEDRRSTKSATRSSPPSAADRHVHGIPDAVRPPPRPHNHRPRAAYTPFSHVRGGQTRVASRTKWAARSRAPSRPRHPPPHHPPRVGGSPRVARTRAQKDPTGASRPPPRRRSSRGCARSCGAPTAAASFATTPAPTATPSSSAPPTPAASPTGSTTASRCSSSTRRAARPDGRQQPGATSG